MCSFTVWGVRGGGFENQSVSGVTTNCLTQWNTSPSHRVVKVVDCGLWNVGPLLFNGCAKLLDIGRYWNTLSYTPIQRIPNMLNGRHVRLVCQPCKNWDVFSFQELCTDSCNRGNALSCCNMRWWSWMNGTTMGLRISSRYLCAFKMPSIKCTCVCLSITYACTYHNPTTTMGHSIDNFDISKTGFIREENTSPKCQPPSNVSICSLKSVTTTNCSQVETPMRTTRMQMSFPETVSYGLCRIFWLCKPIVAAAVRVAGFRQSWRLRWWCGGPGLVWLHVVRGC